MNYEEWIEEKIKEIKDDVKNNIVISALSGGVDSSVCTVLVHKAIRDKLKAYFIDDGLMREKEPENVVKTFKGLGIDVKLVDAKDEFFNALKEIEDAEEKRKAFRNTFYTVFGRLVKESEARFLLQGTIKADIIETKGGVKTQHNILEQIGINPEEQYGFKVIEPLKEFFKHEVRLIAKELGLKEEMYNRMPFPGPGLLCRVLGEVTPERVDKVRKATVIVEEEIKNSGLKPFQCFAVLMNDKATGLKDKQRNYGNIIIVRSVESKDAMTALPTNVSFETLRKIAERITKEIPSVVRVAYEITGKPTGTIEYI